MDEEYDAHESKMKMPKELQYNQSDDERLIFNDQVITSSYRPRSNTKHTIRPRQWSASLFSGTFRRFSGDIDKLKLGHTSNNFFEFDDISPKFSDAEESVQLTEKDLLVKNDIEAFFRNMKIEDANLESGFPKDLPNDSSTRYQSFHDPACIYNDDQTSWSAPSSWAVHSNLNSMKPQLKKPRKKSNPTEEQKEREDLEAGNLWSLRIFKPNLKDDNLNRRITHAYINVNCPVNITVRILIEQLKHRFDSKHENLARFRLFSVHSGSEKLLTNDDKPVKIFRKWLEEIGYREVDNLHEISRQDHSHLFRFIFHEFPLAPPRADLGNQIVEVFSPEGLRIEQPKISEKAVFLSDEYLSVFPVSVFQHMQTIEYMDISRNTVLEYPIDLFEQMQNLRLLRLVGNHLIAPPMAITLLRNLTHLDLSCNSLSGHGLEILASCKSLLSINLSCNLIEHIPDEFGSLISIRHIDLSSNYLVEFPSAFWSMVDIREIDLSFNSIACVPEQIENLRQLRRLILLGNSITSVHGNMRNLTNLRFLDLRSNLFEEDACENIPLEALSDICSSYTHMQKIDLTKAKNLTSLVACHNPLTFLTVSGILPILRVLVLAVCKLTYLPNELFSNTPLLEVLHLERNMITELPDIGVLKNLKTLRFFNNDLAELEGDFSKLECLSYLDLHGNNLKQFPPALWQVPSLKFLNLSSNFISFIPAPQCSNGIVPLASSLSELYFAENRLSNDSILLLRSLTRLTILNISYNMITDLEDSLSEMSCLKELYVSGNEISSLPDNIETLVSLKIIFANDNKLTHIPGELCQLSSLKAVDFSINNLRYNIGNFPFDWNWNYNTGLIYLNLSHNKKLDLNPITNPSKISLDYYSGFSNLKNLRYLNICNVGIMPAKLPLDKKDAKIRMSTEKSDFLKLGVSEYFGRDFLFDQHELICPKFLGQIEDHLVALFDGRGNETVSLYLKENFANIVEDQFKSSAQQENFNIESALRRAFLAANRDLSMQPIQMTHGASATLLYIMADCLYVANVGDTMAIMSRDGNAVILNAKHQPWSRSEQERIRSIGGFISSDGLVERELDITRAIGHHHLLPYVNANPSTSVYQLSTKDEFILLASQSFWKCIKYQVAIDAARSLRDDPDRVTLKLRDMAIAVGACKSMTIIFVSLKSIKLFGDLSNNAVELRRNAFRTVSETQALSRLEAEIEPPRSPCVFVFTDIKDSTPLWRADPLAMRAAMKIHNDLCRRLLRKHGGYEVKHEGDAIMATFYDVTTAIRWSLSVQRYLNEAEWPEPVLKSEQGMPRYSDSGTLLYRGLIVRMGIHSGMCFCETDSTTNRMDYFGTEVIIAARLSSLALGGEILISDTVHRALLDLPQDLFEDFNMVMYSLKPLNLKGFPGNCSAFSVYPADLAERQALRGHSIADSSPL